ncbi:hypothetical protein GGR50DRAFT_659889 [Xylaria sp. CBS 124048]|nr:hypothetical protein GGR50DRAFT_659889 [Xylaria sp. CBS 124048]
MCFSRDPDPAASNPDLTGKTAIVTGSNRGIGLECARQLLDRGLSTLILAVRDERKGARARDELSAGRDLGDHVIEVWRLDYTSYDSIEDFAHRANGLENLDIVILNAGVYRIPHVIVPATGHEETIQVNYLSTCLLTILLVNVLSTKRRSETSPGRLTVVSSSLAASSKLDPLDEERPLLHSLDVPEAPKTFGHYQQYCTSKLLGQLFLSELAKRMPSSLGVVVNCANPGLCYGSGLARDGSGTFQGFLARILFRIFGHTCARGAQVVVDAAVRQGDGVHGQYFDAGKPARFAPMVYTSEGKDLAERLWEETTLDLSLGRIGHAALNFVDSSVD